ncbi:hypothetical protein [Nonomuraea fuscirosea]|uniref:hypothetical protein n=1 Tax=Nonomuraea fuscirosea TaxID=1291556 RepID=UPI003405A003
MAELVPFLLIAGGSLLIIGGAMLCWRCERTWSSEGWFRTLVTGAPGIAFVAMGVVSLAFGFMP